MHPRLLSSLILIDPVIQLYPSALDVSGPAAASTFRRDLWPSRENAETSFLRSKYYQQWDPRVLSRWFKYGLREVPTALYPETDAAPSGKKAVTLCTSKHQEVFTFLRPNFNMRRKPDGTIVPAETNPVDLDPTTPNTYPFYRPEAIVAFKNLPYLRPSVLWVFGGKGAVPRVEDRNEKKEITGIGVGGSGGAKAGRVEMVTFEEVGHLVPMEVVDQTARVAAEWIGREVKRLTKADEKFHAGWSKMGKRQRQVISEEWERMIKPSNQSQKEGVYKPHL